MTQTHLLLLRVRDPWTFALNSSFLNTKFIVFNAQFITLMQIATPHSLAFVERNARGRFPTAAEIFQI